MGHEFKHHLIPVSLFLLRIYLVLFSYFTTMDILILGGGVAGLSSALALTKFAPKGVIPKIQIFEIRPIPATIGGAG